MERALCFLSGKTYLRRPKTTIFMPNRRKMPPIRPVGDISLPPLREWRLRNGMPAYSIDMGAHPGVRIELVFFAGRPYEQKRLVSRAAADMMGEGCLGYDATALSDHFDYYGASISFPISLDTTNVALLCLNKHLPEVLPVFATMLAEPAFDDQELRRFCKQHQQLLREDLSQSDVVAYREITGAIFGAGHPYGYNSKPEDFDTLAPTDLLTHHQRYVQAANGFIIIAGRVTPEVETMIDRYLGQLPTGMPAEPVPFPPCPPMPGSLRLPRPDAWQTSLRIGKQLFSRRHPDADAFYILDTLVGGYFGSRLMMNIREDKGYTYNIESSFDPMLYDGCWYVECEVAHEAANDTLAEIYRELALLRKQPILADELDMLKNYLLGTYLTMVDGPFNTAELLKTLLADRLPLAAFSQMVETTRNITAENLQQLAQTYLQPDSFWEVRVEPGE